MAELKKSLSYPVILLITINSILGTGIFFLPAVGAHHAGPASLLSWAILSVIAIYISMCFAELTSMFPKAGGVYEFCKQAYGRFPSFLIGWMTLLAGNITIAMLVVGAIQYLLPTDAPFLKIALSLLFVYVFNFIAFKGMKTSAVMLIAFAIITLTALFGLIIPGFFQIDWGNLQPFFPLGGSAVFLAIFFIAETFFGWETATFLAEETKDGERVMPKALIVSTVIIAVICLLFVFVALAVMPWEVFGQSSAPLKELGMVLYGNSGDYIFTMLVYLAIIGSVAGWIVSAPRLILSMAKDKLFLKSFAAVHPKYFTPHKAILFQTILTTILVIMGSGSYTTLVQLLVPIVLVMYSFVVLSLVVLRYKLPNQKRYFTAPLGKVGPYFIILFNIALIVGWVWETPSALNIVLLGLSFIACGIPVYFLLEMYYSPKAVRQVENCVAYVALATENIALPKKVRKEIIRLIGNIKGKTILEFGCTVGTLTLQLAEKVGKNGKVYATDLSEKHLAIAQRRMDKHGHDHVKIIQDHAHGHRVHPKVPKVHAVVSVGMLGYLDNVDKVLQHMNQRLAIGAKVCFVDYDKFFDVIPNIDWLRTDERIQEIFKRNGFSIKVERKQGFAWKYIYIYGKKAKNTTTKG